MLTIKHITEISLNAKDFFNFLKRNNAFEAYKCNIINYCKRGSLDVISSFNQFFNDFSCVQSWISGAFHWDNTAQGTEYWKKLNTEWRENFRDCNKINLTPISEEDLKEYFRESITSKWYKVIDNSYNRSADNDPNRIWETISVSGWKDLIGKKYLILEEPRCVIIDSLFGESYKVEMIKVWVPEYNCAQWVLFNSKNVCDTK